MKVRVDNGLGDGAGASWKLSVGSVVLQNSHDSNKRFSLCLFIYVLLVFVHAQNATTLSLQALIYHARKTSSSLPTSSETHALNTRVWLKGKCENSFWVFLGGGPQHLATLTVPLKANKHTQLAHHFNSWIWTELTSHTAVERSPSTRLEVNPLLLVSERESHQQLNKVIFHNYIS